MIRRINPQAVLEFACFSCFSGLTFYFTVSGRYLAYVTPKMAPYLYFTSAVMLVWAVSKVSGIFRPRHRTHAAHCLVLIIPILLLLLPHSPVRASEISSGYLGGNGLSSVPGGASSILANSHDTSAAQGDTSRTDGNAVSGNASNESAPDDFASDGETSETGAAFDTGTETSAQAETESPYDDSLIQQYGLERSEDGSIEVTDDLFYPWLSEIFTNMHRYEGAAIQIKGFVFKDPQTMTSSEFVPARLLMYCCAADLSPCGILCEYDKASELKEDTWVTVTGVIHIGKYQGQDDPQITVTGISPAEKPQEEYVYPW